MAIVYKHYTKTDSYSYFKQMIKGSRPNKTNMVYATLYIEKLRQLQNED